MTLINYTVKASDPITGRIVTEKFDNKERAARWAAKLAMQGYIVEMGNKRYVPSNAPVPIESELK